MYSHIQSNNELSPYDRPAGNFPLVVKTSKQWVLPPRPKPGRKPTAEEKQKQKQLKEMKELKEQTSKKEVVSKKESKEKDKPKKKSAAAKKQSSLGDVLSSLHRSIKQVDSENLALKTNLLSLIHDYKHLRDLVLRYEVPETATVPSLPTSPIEFGLLSLTEEFDSNAHKRSYNELMVKEGMDNSMGNGSLLSDLISDMSGLSHRDEAFDFINFGEDAAPAEAPLAESTSVSKTASNSKAAKPTNIKPSTNSKISSSISKSSSTTQRNFAHYKDFEKLDTVEDSDIDIDFEDDDEPSMSLSVISRTMSPSSDIENNSLMGTLTRSTTVSSVNTTSLESKKSGYPFKNYGTSARFFDLPKFEESQGDSYQFQFDEVMNQPSSFDDYMVNDFLEEKPTDGYYVENVYNGKW